MELIRYWRVMRRWAWLIILCPLVAALAAGLISLQVPKVYEAQATLLVKPTQPLPGTQGTVAPETIDQILRTYARLITLRPVLERVISDQGLRTDPVSLSHRITVTPEPNTTILDVAVQDTDPARAQGTANALIDDFLAYFKGLPGTSALDI